MAFQAAPDVLEAQIRYTLQASVKAMNVLHFSKTGYVLADADDLAELIDAWVGDTWRPILSNAVTYRETYVKGLASSIDVQSISSLHAGNGGVSSTGISSQAGALAVKLSSGQTGRSSRGRIFVPVLGSEALDNATTVKSTFVTSVINALGGLMDDVVAAGFTWVTLSRRNGGSLRTTAVPFSVVEISVTDNILDSQRKRLAGRGE